MVEEYTRKLLEGILGLYGTSFLFCSVLFSRKRGRKWFIMDNDASQRSVAARKAIEKECCEFQQDL